MSAHLVSAARELERLLAEVHPEHAWVVNIKADQRGDRQRLAAAAIATDDSGTIGDDLNPIADRDNSAASGALHDHRFDEAA